MSRHVTMAISAWADRLGHEGSTARTHAPRDFPVGKGPHRMNVVRQYHHRVDAERMPPPDIAHGRAQQRDLFDEQTTVPVCEDHGEEPGPTIDTWAPVIRHEATGSRLAGRHGRTKRRSMQPESSVNNRMVRGGGAPGVPATSERRTVHLAGARCTLRSVRRACHASSAPPLKNPPPHTMSGVPLGPGPSGERKAGALVMSDLFVAERPA